MAKQQCIITSRTDYEDAISNFQLYKPVKVARELKDDFHHALTRHFINIGVEKWSATIYSLVKCYKFKRT